MKSHSSQRRFLTMVLVGLSCLANVGGAQTVPAAAAPATSVGPILLRDESIDQVLVLLERWTGKTILRPQALPGATISLTLKGNVTREEAIRALETLLTLNGIAISPLDDKFLKVTPLTNAKSEAPELIDGSTLGLPPSGRVASKVFQLNFLRVGEFMPQITGLLNPAAGSPPVVFESANAALITDSLSNLQRIETLLVKFDQPRLGGLQTKFYPLHFAKASEVVAKMHTILAGALQSQLGSSTTFSPDDRTNQVVLVTDPRQYEFFDNLIARLDVKSDANTRNDVIYLKYASAKDVASSLAQLVSTQNGAAHKAGTEGPAPAASRPATPGPAPTPATQPANVSALESLKGETSNQFSALLTILPEDRSNAIIVSGTEGDIRLINELITKIDIILAQVRIEVVIAEVSLTDSATTGISALGLQVQNGKLVGFTGAGAGFGVTNGSLINAATGTSELSAVIALNTTPRKNDTNILSVPTILTTHGKEGKLFVGESRPVISSYLNDTNAVGTASGTGYRSTVNMQDIGIELSVKPLIGLDGAVQLEVKQEVSDILGEILIDGNPQPRIGKRTTDSFITAKNGEIIVLGGMQRDSRLKSTSRLGPLPWIGDLLGSRTNEVTRTDLVFFLRPTVLTNTPADNAPAIEHLKQFPPEQREQVRKVINPLPAQP
jgi:general secretion pathway protein D